jgi:hypothetical protein
MKNILLLFILSTLFVFKMFSQPSDSSYIEFLKSAPANVKEYYQVFDSLANLTDVKVDPQKWSLDELMKYASLVYDANEYDPITQQKHWSSCKKIANKTRGHHPTNFIDVYLEVKRRISEKHTQLLKVAYWVTLVVDNIETLPYISKDGPDTKIIEYRVHGKVTEVWKGGKYNIGDEITGYYLDLISFH